MALVFRAVAPQKRRKIMQSWPHTPPAKQNFHKRRSFEQGNAEIDAAHVATRRLYCDALRFWRRCGQGACKRHRRCCGDASLCLLRGLIFVWPSRRLRAQQKVIAGGSRRIPPATHFEWTVRRNDFKSVVSWDLG
jgi:hypothetical protein